MIAACHLSAVSYVILFVRDTRKPAAAADGCAYSYSPSELFSLGHLADSWRTCFVSRSPMQRRRLVLLLAMATLLMTLQVSRRQNVLLYTGKH